MNKVYVITDIVHSGRKGIRGERVTEEKYVGLIGIRVNLDIDNIQPYKTIKMNLLDHHPYYNWWTTSIVIASIAEDDKVEIETANTIYRLTEWKSNKEEKEAGD